jgi:hypothetical protein
VCTIVQVVSRHNAVEQDAALDRMIVVARGKEDVSYLSIFLPDIPHTVYQVGAEPAAHHVLAACAPASG